MTKNSTCLVGLGICLREDLGNPHIIVEDFHDGTFIAASMDGEIYQRWSLDVLNDGSFLYETTRVIHCVHCSRRCDSPRYKHYKVEPRND